MLDSHGRSRRFESCIAHHVVRIESRPQRALAGVPKRRDIGRIILIFLIAPTAKAASAQDWARERVEKSPRHREWVTVKHDGSTVETFAVYPESSEANRKARADAWARWKTILDRG